MDTRDIDHIGVCFSDCGIGESQENREEYAKVFGHAKDWYAELDQSEARSIAPRILEKRLRGHVTSNIKPAGFLPAFVWWFVGRAIMNYIINKIMEVIMSKRK